MLNIALLIEQAALRTPENQAVTCADTSITYKNLYEAVCRTANVMQKKGVKQGDKIALLCPNRIEYPIIFFAVLQLGAVVVPISTYLKADEIAYQLKDSECVLFFCYEGDKDITTGMYGREAIKLTDRDIQFYSLGEKDGHDSFFSLYNGQSTYFEIALTSPDDTAVIIYTSGTTGKPKGAELTHSNLFTNAEASTAFLHYKEGEVSIVVLPLFHIFGLTVMMLAGIRKSMHLVLVPKFDPQIILLSIKKYNATIFGGVPSMYWALLEQPENEEKTKTLSTLRMCISGGSSLPLRIINDFRSLYKLEIMEGYGMSEGSPVVTFNQIESGTKPGSIGKEIWGVQVKIVDEDGHEVPLGEKGELIYRGPNVMKSYYKRPLETQEILKKGWLYSGDIAYKDQDGFYFIVDRKKEMIIRGGMNVYPKEIELLLAKHPAVSLVAVVGVADDKFGEEVAAFIILNKNCSATAEDIIGWSRERLASYKYPRIIKFVKEFPINASGKILKRNLKL